MQLYHNTGAVQRYQDVTFLTGFRFWDCCPTSGMKFVFCFFFSPFTGSEQREREERAGRAELLCTDAEHVEEIPAAEPGGTEGGPVNWTLA